MAEILLIHGSCHGAWCWRDVIPELTTLGHTARAIDLPGHGDDGTPAEAVTLDSYADAILSAVDSPCILLGHSMAGYPITLAADRAPDAFTRLIYLCAYVPLPDVSMVDMRRAAPRQPLMPAIRLAPDGVTFTIDPDMAPDVFYQDCPQEAVEYAVARLCPQPIAPQDVPIRLTGAGRAIPRSYILCRNDQTIPPEYQEEMVRDWPPGDVHRIDTGHSPFFADPAGLAALIDRIVRA